MKRSLFSTCSVRMPAALLVALLASVLLVPASLPGQMSGPGWFNVSSRSAPAASTNDQGGGVMPLGMMMQEEESQTELFSLGMGATEATPAITELARGLRNDPLLIYDYVRNHIDFEPYFGSLKGATGTYLDGAGNDFDQASLMIALLQAGGTTGQYAIGTVTIPAANAANWVGVTNDMAYVSAMFSDGGLPPVTNTASDITLTHVWVRVTSGTNVWLFAPAYKQYEYRSGVDLASAMSYNRGSLLHAATNGAEVTGDYVRNLSENGIRGELLKYSTNLAAYVRNNCPNDDVLSFIGGRQIVPDYPAALPTTLPFTATQTAVWDAIPSNYVHHLRVQFGSLDATLNIPELNGSRLAVTFAADDNTVLGQNLLTNTLVSEGFEGSFPSGWSVGDSNSGGTPAYWDKVASGFGGVTSASGSYMGYCAGAGHGGDDSNPVYRDRMTAYMERTFDLSGNGLATLTFKSRIPSIQGTFDFCRVRVNNTVLWTKTAADSGWTTETVNLNAYAGNASVTVRFEFMSDEYGTFVGWFLDDVSLIGIPGDKFDRATGIARDTDVAGNIAGSGDLAVYRVRLRAGGHYTITVPGGTQSGMLMDPQLWLFGTNKTQIAYDDDSYIDGTGSKIIYDCTATGDFFVQVGGVSTGTGTFTLRVAEQTPGPVMPATLWKEDVALKLEDPLSTPHPSNLVLTVIHPYLPAWYATNASQQVTYPLVRGGTYAIIRGFGGGDSGKWLKSRQRQLEAYRSLNLAATSREIVSETLNVIGQTWIDETALAGKMIDRLAGVRTLTHHRFGVMAQETGFYVDVKAQAVTMTATNGSYSEATAGFKTLGLIHSAMEHAVLEQMQGTNQQSASTIKLLKLANQNGKKIYLANASNYVARVRAALQYTTAEKAAFSNFVAAGGQLLLPETNSITLNQWRGEGYMVFTPDYGSGSSIAMVIGGGYFGGYSGSEVPVNPDNVYANSVSTLAYDATEPHPVSVEPVDLVTGAYLHRHEDLALGGAEPRGLHLVREYNSDQGNQKTVLGNGWTHSYDISIQTSSDFRSALGLRTPLDAVPAMVAIVATLDLAGNTDSVEGWTTAALVNQWATDQFTENARNAMLGAKALTYVKLPDGTFVPPPGVTTALSMPSGLYRLTERFGTHYDFGTNLRLSSWSDVDGNAMSFEYNASTNLQSVTDCFGRQLTFSYTNGLLASVSHGGSPARSVSYTYSTAGDLTQYTDPEGFVWKQNYDTAHRIVSLYDPTPQLTATNIYDSVGHVMTQKNGFGNAWNFYFSDFRNVEEDPQGGQKVYYYDDKRRQIASELVAGSPSYAFYDGQDHVVAAIDPQGRNTWLLYDGNQNLTNTVDALTNRTILTYDTLNRLVAVRDPSGGLTQFGFDANHHLTNTVDALGNAVASSYYTSGASKGLVSAVAYPGGISASYTYTNGQVASITRTDGGVSSVQYDIVGNPTMATDANGHATRISFDKRGLPVSVLDALNNTVSNVYNSAGLRIRTVDALGRTNTLAYTPTYNVASVRFPDGGFATNSFDTRDLPVRIMDPRGYSTSNTFDAAWRKIAVTDPLANKVTLVLDPVGNPVSVTNALGLATATTFDPLNRPVVVTDPLQRQWRTAYDPRGVVANTTDAKGRVTSYVLDALGRRAGATYPSGRAEGFGFDALGRMTAFTNAEGHVYRLAYDGMNRVIAATNAAGEQVFRNFFDPAGNLTNRLDGAGRLVRNQFDALNRCTNTVYTDGSTEVFAFDAAGNLLTAKNAAATNMFGYDSMNRLTSAVSRVAGVAFTNLYRHDLGGLTTNVVYPGGNSVRYLFDANGRMTNVTDWAGHSWQVTRDAAGRMAALAYPNGISGVWGYDAASAVTNWGYSGSAGLPSRKITRDTMGLKTRENVASGPTPTPTTNRRTVNTFDAADRLTSAQVTQGTNTSTEVYYHDLCGALTNIVRSTGTNDVYANDLAGRMISATTSNLSLAAGYDAFGNRIATTVNGTSRLWVIDHNDPLKRPLMETDTNGAPVRYYVWEAGTLLAVIDADGTTRFAHSDEQGSIVALTDAGGSVLFTANYGPYGEPWGTAGTNATPFGWLGGHGVFHAGGSSLYLTRHRAYDTTLRRFLSVDPLGIGGGANLYAYASGNPLAYIDPFGLSSAELAGGWDSGNSFAAGQNSVAVAGQYVPALDDPWLTFLENVNKDILPSDATSGHGLAGYLPGVGWHMEAQQAFDSHDYLAVALCEAMVVMDVFLMGRASAAEGIGANIVRREASAAGETLVYRSLNAAGDVNYVGITGNFERRASEQLVDRGIQIEQLPGLSGLSRADARAVEQVLIENYGLKKNGGTLINQINSISPYRPFYEQSLQRGRTLLNQAKYPGF